jgi:hypothetical protein
LKRKDLLNYCQEVVKLENGKLFNQKHGLTSKMSRQAKSRMMGLSQRL